MGRAMAQVVGRRPLIAEARGRTQTSPCEIWGGQSGTGTRFPRSTSVSRCQYYSTNAPFLSSSTCFSYQKEKRAKSGNL
jgi:hypothetical protein